MTGWKIRLFGKFRIEREEKLIAIEPRKVQELFGYLLLFRNHPQLRELLSETLWGDQSSTKSRKSLRQTLWRLQSALGKQENSAQPALLIDNDWIQIVLPPDFWLDTAEFEKIFNSVKGKRIQELRAPDFKKMQFAADIYEGNLLEGCYQDWCVFERERFQTMQLMLLDKLVQYCELHQLHDVGLDYGLEILRHDRTYERAHRQLMRLYFLNGNRTQALHQYARCVMTLREELGVEPAERTNQLYEQIRLDTFKPPEYSQERSVSTTSIRANPGLKDVLNRLEEVSEMLSRLEHRIQEEIITVGDPFSSQR
jgi:DNA-binding transcriptional activator of the SARP family